VLCASEAGVWAGWAVLWGRALCQRALVCLLLLHGTGSSCWPLQFMLGSGTCRLVVATISGAMGRPGQHAAACPLCVQPVIVGDQWCRGQCSRALRLQVGHRTQQLAAHLQPKRPAELPALPCRTGGMSCVEGCSTAGLFLSSSARGGRVVASIWVWGLGCSARACAGNTH
jgi:hypothetical protein